MVAVLQTADPTRPSALAYIGPRGWVSLSVTSCQTHLIPKLQYIFLKPKRLAHGLNPVNLPQINNRIKVDPKYLPTLEKSWSVWGGGGVAEF